jgi:hypothetical protein
VGLGGQGVTTTCARVDDGGDDGVDVLVPSLSRTVWSGRAREKEKKKKRKKKKGVWRRAGSISNSPFEGELTLTIGLSELQAKGCAWGNGRRG